MGLTRRGVLVLGVAPALALLSWLFGLPEAAVLAVGATTVVLVAWAWVLLRRPDLEIRRVARPARCTVGDACQIQLQSRNRSQRRSPVVLLTDDVGRHGIAQLHLGPLQSGESATAAYTLPADRRGLHRVGPLRVTVEDPFQLARSTSVEDSFITVIVLPRTWPLSPLRGAPGDEPEQGVKAITSLSTVDEEFSALRAYVPGDDIRLIHWRSTARTGSPVVRQFDRPWQHRSTIVIDQRSLTGDSSSFERAISVAASVVQLAATRGELVRLVSTGPGGTDAGFVSAGEQLDSLMDRLAGISAINGDGADDSTSALDALGAPDAPDATRSVAAGRLVRVVADLSTTATGRLVICSDSVSATEQLELDRVSDRFGLRLLVSTAAGAPAPHSGGLGQIHWNGAVPLDQAWRLATGDVTTTAADGVRR